MKASHCFSILALRNTPLKTAITSDRRLLYVTEAIAPLTCGLCAAPLAQCFLCGWLGHFPQLVLRFRQHGIPICAACHVAALVAGTPRMAAVYSRILEGQHWMLRGGKGPGPENWLPLVAPDGALELTVYEG